MTRDRAGRWHVAFAVIPGRSPDPGTGETVGIDRGVARPAALSTGELLTVPGLARPRAGTTGAALQRKLAKAQRGSNRRGKLKLQSRD